ncbi:MAG TPA: hypothetical protein VI072_33430 [Polyangiaceae bacterium]
MKVSALLAVLVVVGLFGTVACGDDDADPGEPTCKGADIDTPTCNVCADAKCCRELRTCKGTCLQLNNCTYDNEERCAEAESEDELKTCFTEYCGAFMSAWDQAQNLGTCLLENCADECGAIVE